jgi:50S ribosomal protein L16 3-hydroxylase
VHQALSRRRPGRDDTERFLLRFLTEPKASVVFSRPPHPLSALPFARRADQNGLRLNRASRMLYARGAVAINGECHRLPASSRATLRELADRRELDPGCLIAAAPALIVLLHDWYTAGWLSLQTRSGNAR